MKTAKEMGIDLRKKFGLSNDTDRLRKEFDTNPRKFEKVIECFIEMGGPRIEFIRDVLFRKCRKD